MLEYVIRRGGRGRTVAGTSLEGMKMTTEINVCQFYIVYESVSLIAMIAGMISEIL